MNIPLLPNVSGNQTISGQMGMNDVAELRKALEAGYGTDVAGLTGGGALRIQSLERTMLSTIQENRHFALFNLLAKSNATATIDEWTEQSGVGGFLGGSTNTESGTINAATGDYARRTGQVKYLMTRREVSFVTSLQNAIVEAEAVEAANGAKQLLTDAEFLCFEGDSTVVPTEFDGIYAQIVGLGSTDHVIDAEGQSLASVESIVKAAATISRRGNFGTPTHLFFSPMVGADMDANFDPAYRVGLPNGQEAKRGTPVRGIVTAQGDIDVVRDVFIRDDQDQSPFELDNSALATANAGMKPQTVAGTPGAGAADTKWGSTHAGNYYYAVAGVSASGQSTVLVSAQVAVAAGQQVSLAIGASAGNAETGYAIYRGRKNGTNAVADLRFVTRIPKTAGGTTTWLDKNREIPGTSKAYVLNLSSGDLAINWRQFLPMTKFALYPTLSATIPWAQLLFGYLRIGKRKHHVVIKNILSSNASWKPFG